MAVGFQWSLYTAVVLFSVHATHSPRSSQGLSCVNDFVKTVTCTWRDPLFDPSLDCWISGVKITYQPERHIVRSCKLKQHGEFPGCSFSFDRMFNSYEKMPNISVTCNSTLVKTWLKYSPDNHIKMHPPGTPNVSSSINMTRISWDPGRPHSRFLKSLNFEVQIKQIHQSWNEVKNEPTSDQEMVIWKKLKGHHQVRVRVKPDKRNNSHWSDWSPTTSWVAEDGTSQDKAVSLDQASLFIRLTSVLCLGLTFASLLALYRCYVRKRLMREKTVPNPSKYFRTLHSVHGGNLKGLSPFQQLLAGGSADTLHQFIHSSFSAIPVTMGLSIYRATTACLSIKWLNPLAASNSFFVARPCENISAVEVCDSWDMAPSTSPCSTSALLHFPPTAESTRHHVDHLSSCSSSCFSNMGYFMSSYNSSLAQTRTSPYFSYQGNVLSPHKKLHLSLCPTFNSLSIYESLRREPQSPDSGFGIGKFEDQDIEALDDNQCSPLLHLPLSVTSLTPTPSHPSALNLVFDNQVLEEDTPIAACPAASGNLSAWPVAGPMCRASSLPVDSCKSGYLTLKELQTTFSNKSI